MMQKFGILLSSSLEVPVPVPLAFQVEIPLKPADNPAKNPRNVAKYDWFSFNFQDFTLIYPCSMKLSVLLMRVIWAAFFLRLLLMKTFKNLSHLKYMAKNK